MCRSAHLVLYKDTFLFADLNKRGGFNYQYSFNTIRLAHKVFAIPERVDTTVGDGDEARGRKPESMRDDRATRICRR